MKRPWGIALALGCGTLALSAGYQPRLDLRGPKDRVLKLETRRDVLEVAQTLTGPRETEMDVELADLKSPFLPFRRPEPEPEDKAANKDEKPEKPEEPEVVYSDAMVLRAAAAKLRKRVRGYMGRGDAPFLQLEGGTLLEEGAELSVRVAQVREQPFALVIEAITPRFYVLRLNEETMKLFFNDQGPAQDGVRLSGE